MKKTNWLAITLISVLALIALFWIGSWMGGGYCGYGMMERYGGMMNWGYSPFVWFGMAFMWLIPIGVIALVVYGVVALTRNVNLPPAAPLTPCPNCGKGTQADWQNCPYCGTALK